MSKFFCYVCGREFDSEPEEHGFDLFDYEEALLFYGEVYALCDDCTNKDLDTEYENDIF